MTATMMEGSVAEREIIISRVIPAPRDLVFRTFTDARHVSEWWGPRGFRTTTHAQDLRPGGQWRFTMHGPDGTDYENLVTYRRIEPPSLLQYEHGETVPADCFDVTVTFEEVGSRQTRVTLRMLVASAEVKARMVEFGAVEGGTQTLERLDEILAQREIVITRQIDAPRTLVYRAFTDPAHLVRWFGPEGFTSRGAEVDLTIGGVWRIVMVGPDGAEYPVKGTYMDIVPNERLVYLDEWVADFQPTKSMVVHLDFTEQDGGTRLTLRTVLASEEDRKTVVEMGVVEGWAGSFDKLQAMVGKPRPRLTIGLPNDREIVMARSFAAPVTKVYEAYTTPEHMRQWWGPRGFEMVSCDMDFRPGGKWRFVQRGPDGVECAFRGEYREIVPNELISQTFEFEGAPGQVSEETIRFRGDATHTTVRMHSIFPSPEARDGMIDSGMEWGANETMDRLGALVEVPQ
jgi:uncharacterized protein YndB with AHSA1/START domain